MATKPPGRSTQRPPVAARERFVLDPAHVGDIQRRVRHDRPARGGSPRTALAGDGAARDHRPRTHRHGRRQRRRRRRHLFTGGPELRHEPAVGAVAASPRADRQPGDGRAARRRHRSRSRAADQRALRALLGLVLGRRSVRVELPHDRHGVHRRQSRARLLRRLRRTSRSRSPRCYSSRSRSAAASAPGSAGCSCSSRRTFS